MGELMVNSITHFLNNSKTVFYLTSAGRSSFHTSRENMAKVVAAVDRRPRRILACFFYECENGGFPYESGTIFFITSASKERLSTIFWAVTGSYDLKLVQISFQ